MTTQQNQEFYIAAGMTAEEAAGADVPNPDLIVITSDEEADRLEQELSSSPVTDRR